MHFLEEQFQQQKMLPQRDFCAGRFSAVGVQNEVTPRITPEAQVPRNCLPIVIKAILLIRAPSAH